MSSDWWIGAQLELFYEFAGYNSIHLPLMISDPDVSLGAVQVLGKQLIFLNHGIPLHQHRDGYLFGFSIHQFYTTAGFVQVIKEFLEKSYELVVNDDIMLIQKPDFVVRELRKPTLEDLTTLGLR